jgi:hypothetical protein
MDLDALAMVIVVLVGGLAGMLIGRRVLERLRARRDWVGVRVASALIGCAASALVVALSSTILGLAFAYILGVTGYAHPSDGAGMALIIFVALITFGACVAGLIFGAGPGLPIRNHDQTKI